MNQYVTGTVIKELREKNNMTQTALADKLGVSDKSRLTWNNDSILDGDWDGSCVVKYGHHTKWEVSYGY